MTTPLIVAVGCLLLCIAIRVPVAFALAAAGFLGIVATDGLDIAALTAGRTPFASISQYGLIVIPLFIAIGMFIQRAGLAEKIFSTVDRKFHRVPGGQRIVTVLSCAAFAAVSGSSAATTATIGRVAIGEMLARGTSRAQASGVVAAAATLGILIPPSIALVFYGIVTNESIGRLLLAGIIPGILSAVLYIVWILASSSIRSKLAVPAFGAMGISANTTLKDRHAHAIITEHPHEAEIAPRSLGNGWGTLTRVFFVFFSVMGTIFFGIATVTEAAGVGVVASLLILFIDRREHGLSTVYRDVRDSLSEALRLTGMIVALLIGGAIFANFVVRSGLVSGFAEFMVGVELPNLLLLTLLLGVLILFGMFMDGISILIVSMPIVYPAVVAMGYDGIWFGVVAIKIIELGLITPPMGIGVYIAAGTHKSISVEDVFRGVLPYYGIDLVTIVVFIAYPQIVTALPNLVFD